MSGEIGEISGETGGNVVRDRGRCRVRYGEMSGEIGGDVGRDRRRCRGR